MSMEAHGGMILTGEKLKISEKTLSPIPQSGFQNNQLKSFTELRFSSGEVSQPLKVLAPP
jgi:hypothetical protein